MVVAAEKGRDNEDRDLRALCTHAHGIGQLAASGMTAKINRRTGVPGIVIFADIVTPWKLAWRNRKIGAGDR